MAVNPNNLSYITLADLFEVNGKKVYKAFANGVQVYPEEEPEPSDIYEHNGYKFMAIRRSFRVTYHINEYGETISYPAWLCGPYAFSHSLQKAIYIGVKENQLNRLANVAYLISQYEGELYIINLDYGTPGNPSTTSYEATYMVSGDTYHDISRSSALTNMSHLILPGSSIEISPTVDVPVSENKPLISRTNEYIQWLLTQDVPRIGA